MGVGVARSKSAGFDTLRSPRTVLVGEEERKFHGTLRSPRVIWDEPGLNAVSNSAGGYPQLPLAGRASCVEHAAAPDGSHRRMSRSHVERSLGRRVACSATGGTVACSANANSS